MKHYRVLFLVLALAIGFSGCQYFQSRLKRDETVLARVNNDYLYASAIHGLVPEGMSPTDSLAMVRNFVENWVRNRLVLQKAEKNLSPEQKDFSRQLEEYRNSLVVYTYETRLISQLLDTAVSMQEIETYYENNKQNFLLRDNIVKMAYLKVHKDSLHAGRMARKFLEPDTILDFDRFEKFCLTRTQAYQVSLSAWFLFRDLLAMAPITAYNEELFLKNNRLIDLSDDQSRYLIRIYQFVAKDAVSPLAVEAYNIKAIILNARKQELMKKMRQGLYEQAVKDKEVEIY